ncbi:hypothetical protein [Longimicrobium terrae]|uniref:Uncharacterized protein n=1 Tax=Longimicrobium terrae TaxID=1639882 RepID=A0A841GWE9_9BACT|nr:hypothetical protein [Longimicrobium terrae]MBB4635579.1 hypothetical protein [Longimicrobium terrae]MBB6069973.1 hypothetical protein [Longimicrobium terrae]NNC32884.1 hypothetical protein [Longimicrobium terrae]
MALFPIWAVQLVRIGSGRTGPVRGGQGQGELFVFSTTISASALGTGLFERDMRLPLVSFPCAGLIFMLLISGGLVFQSLDAKLDDRPPVRTSLNAGLAIFCASVSSLLAYLVHGSRSIG